MNDRDVFIADAAREALDGSVLAATTSFAPHIPRGHEATVRGVHGVALPTDEPLLVVVDASVWGSAADHLAVTARRILWKSPTDDPGWLFTAAVVLADLVETDGEATLGGIGLGLSGREGADAMVLVAALVAAETARPAAQGTQLEAETMAVQERLSAFEGLHYAPSIPAAKERAARAVHAGLLPDDEPLIALYDDTVFGGGDDGFLVSAARVCARSYQRPRWSLRFDEHDPEQVHLEDGWLQLGAGRSLFLTDRRVLPRLRRLLADLAVRPGGPYR